MTTFVFHNSTKDIFELIKQDDIDYNKLIMAVKLVDESSQKVLDSLSEVAQDAKREAHEYFTKFFRFN
jgi:hypothetical protein